MSSLLQSTKNMRALPVGSLKYIRSDCPDNLSDEEVAWLASNNVLTIVDLREELEYTRKRNPGEWMLPGILLSGDFRFGGALF